jgi:hypothetical protein
MLYKFKSRATADVIMLQTNGRQVLQIIGKSPDEAHGIITVEQIPAAISALEAAVEQDNARRREQAQREESPTEDAGQKAGDEISLGQRAAPFIDMLRRSGAEGREVVW